MWTNDTKTQFWNGKVLPFLAGMVVMALIGMTGYMIFSNNGNPAPEQSAINPTPGGSVTLVNNSPDTAGQSTTTKPTTIGAVPTVDYSELPYSMDLPSGWGLTNSDTKNDPCGGDSEWKTATYSNGAETIIVYENGNPNNCGGDKIADLYLDFDYVDSDSTIMVNDNIDLALCTKEENPACPKGDGKVSIFIGNEISGGYTVNKVNGNTYFFSIEDTEVENDIQAQVRSLANLVEVIKFN